MIPLFAAKIFVVIASGLFLSVIFMPFFIALGKRVNMIAKRQYFEEKYKTVPVTGGICIFLLFAAAFFFIRSSFSFPFEPKIWGMALGGLAIHLVGIYDDFKKTAVPLKIIGQIISVIIPVCFGLRIQIVYFSDFLNILFTVVWLVFIINSFNFLDILDGLTAGVGAISLLAFGIISFLTESFILSLFSFVLSGILLGFLVYNFVPARIYMGDSGSMFLGFLIGCISIAISYAPLGKEMALFTPLIVLGLPIFDTVFVVFVRIANRRSIFRGSLDHLALRLIASGMTEKQSVFSIYALSLLFLVNGIVIRQTSNIVGFIFVVFNILLCIVIGVRMSKIRVDR